MGRLEGKVAIVTGGASGIGAATLRRLSAEGARVVCADVNDDAGERVAREISTAGGIAAHRHCDVSELGQVEAVVAFACQAYGGLDIIFNNAAWSGGGYVHTIDPVIWDKSLRVMLTAVFYGIRAAVPAMLERGGGSIINTASVEGLFGEILASPYATAKAGVINLTRNAAIEYGRVGIRVNSIAPGVVETPMLELMLRAGKRSRAELEEMHALGRLLRPAEIANLVLFLASDESSAITGANLVIDGGLTSGLHLAGFPPLSKPPHAKLTDR
jgi:NAD(P)-dependent dehydrogenase (short-subunit alcohol dehydrogenase family)